VPGTRTSSLRLPKTRMHPLNKAARAAALFAWIALALLFTRAVAFAATPAPLSGADLYRQSVEADDHVSYYATMTTVVYEGDRAVSTVARIDHQAPFSWRIWFMAPSDAYGRLIVSNEQQAYQYEPNQNHVISHDWSTAAPGVAEPVNVDTVLKNYSVEIGPVSSIAGRATHSVSLVSRYTGNVAQRLWVDDQTKLIMRREDYNALGAVTMQTSFDSIRIGATFPSGLFALTVPKGMTLVSGFDYGKSTQNTAQLLKIARFSFAMPKYLPEGFSLLSGSVAERNGIQNIQLVYGDGLRTFSLFENGTSRLPSFDQATPKPVQVGAQSGEYADVDGQTLVSWNDSGLNLTIVGNLSEKESANIGASIRP
jgi:outer membrane lipoprotein-sorting protein